MPKAKLDATFAAAAQCEPGKRKTDYWDTAITGFVLECREGGGKTWALRYDDGSRQRQYKIARYGDITADRARREATRIRSEVVLGGDPSGRKQELKAIPTYAELAKMHLADAQLHQKSYSTTEANVRLHLLPRWGKLKLNEIDSRLIATWLSEKSAAGYSAATIEKLRVTLGRSFELAMRWNIPGVVRNPTKGIPRKPLNNARERFLTPAEASRLLKAVSASGSPYLKYVVGLLLLTGCRVGELLRAEWKHVDREQRRWLIPTSKNGRSRYVPLSEAAIDVLNQIPTAGERYLFPNLRNPTKPMSCVTNAWQTARKEAHLNDLRIHDLRHSAASFMINSGVDLFTVGKVLGHSSYQSTQRYSHLANDTLLAAVEAGAKKLSVDWSRSA